MKHRYPPRTWIGLGGVALLSLYTSLQPRDPVNPDPFHVEEFRRRFQVLIPDLPPDSHLGYVSDTPNDEGAMRAIQYALAPRFLVDDAQPHRLVVGNFAQPVDAEQFAEAHGFTVVKVHPQGVVLFEMRPE